MLTKLSFLDNFDFGKFCMGDRERTPPRSSSAAWVSWTHAFWDVRTDCEQGLWMSELTVSKDFGCQN